MSDLDSNPMAGLVEKIGEKDVFSGMLAKAYLLLTVLSTNIAQQLFRFTQFTQFHVLCCCGIIAN